MKPLKASLVLLLLALTCLGPRPAYALFDMPVELYVDAFPLRQSIFGPSLDKNSAREAAAQFTSLVKIVRDTLANDIKAAERQYPDRLVEIAVSRATGLLERQSGLRPTGRSIPSFFAQLRGNPAVCGDDGCRLVLLAEISEDRWVVLLDLRTSGTVVLPSLILGGISFWVHARYFWVREPDGNQCIYALGGIDRNAIRVNGDWIGLIRTLSSDLVWWATGSHPVYEKTDQCVQLKTFNTPASAK